MLRPEREKLKCQSMNSSSYPTDYENGFRNSKQKYKISEVGTIVWSVKSEGFVKFFDTLNNLQRELEYQLLLTRVN